jgi:putative effector of murein hydrolase LrgA (UPF0299 family)
MTWSKEKISTPIIGWAFLILGLTLLVYKLGWLLAAASALIALGFLFVIADYVRLLVDIILKDFHRKLDSEGKDQS